MIERQDREEFIKNSRHPVQVIAHDIFRLDGTEIRHYVQDGPATQFHISMHADGSFTVRDGHAAGTNREILGRFQQGDVAGVLAAINAAYPHRTGRHTAGTMYAATAEGRKFVAGDIVTRAAEAWAHDTWALTTRDMLHQRIDLVDRRPFLLA